MINCRNSLCWLTACLVTLQSYDVHSSANPPELRESNSLKMASLTPEILHSIIVKGSVPSLEGDESLLDISMSEAEALYFTETCTIQFAMRLQSQEKMFWITKTETPTCFSMPRYAVIVSSNSGANWAPLDSLLDMNAIARSEITLTTESFSIGNIELVFFNVPENTTGINISKPKVSAAIDAIFNRSKQSTVQGQ